MLICFADFLQHEWQESFPFNGFGGKVTLLHCQTTQHVGGAFCAGGTALMVAKKCFNDRDVKGCAGKGGVKTRKQIVHMFSLGRFWCGGAEKLGVRSHTLVCVAYMTKCVAVQCSTGIELDGVEHPDFLCNNCTVHRNSEVGVAVGGRMKQAILQNVLSSRSGICGFSCKVGSGIKDWIWTRIARV